MHVSDAACSLLGRVGRAFPAGGRRSAPADDKAGGGRLIVRSIDRYL
jgi:hypothetical protein